MSVQCVRIQSSDAPLSFFSFLNNRSDGGDGRRPDMRVRLRVGDTDFSLALFIFFFFSFFFGTPDELCAVSPLRSTLIRN